jgi:hypothetical protein
MPKSTIPAAAILLMLLLPQPGRAEGAVTLGELMAAMAAVPERHGNFREERRLSALTTPLHSVGRLIYRRPAHLEKLTDAPLAESLVVDGNRLTLELANEVPRVIDLGSQPELGVLVDAMRGPLSGDAAALQRAFSVQIQGSLAAWRLDLAPVDPRAARLLRTVRISGTGADMREVLVIQANGDEQYMTIEPAP